MDSECASLLPQVCEVLADSRRSLPDDTSLEKLLDWFTGLTKSDFIEPLLHLQTDTSLFVASAANQTLVHILLSSPLPSSEEEQDDKTAQMSTGTDVVVAVSEFLAASLVPRDRSQLRRSLQTLRLLAGLLSQAGDPLRDTLLRTVLDPLEELAKADYSQLTLPLMESIMAAHRTSSDSVHTVQAVRILLQPLYILTGHPLLGATDDLAMVEHLKSKPACISMICVSLTHAPQITDMPCDMVSCPPDSVVSAVLSVLKICSGFSPPADSRRVSRNVIGSSKVQKCALEALTALSASPDLTAAVGKRVCDMRWEVRDSTVEFLGHLATEPGGGSASEALLSRGWITSLLTVALQDAESYVRASAVAGLAGTLTQRCQQGAAGEESVPGVLLRGSADLDWEVKVYTLELAELLLDRAFSGRQNRTKPRNHPRGAALGQEEAEVAAALSRLVELGVVSVLLGGLVDCDRPVALKACQLLVTLRETLCPLSGGLVDAVPCELPERGWGEEISRILGAEKRDAAGGKPGVDGDPEDPGDADGTVSVCELLASLGLDQKLDVLSQSSDHVHNSALSLLQDILAAGVTHTHPETQPGQEVIVDCY
ncbi:unnamed protein product [Tetraodon nigroviridis]|uniref:(spotted green pufferfish) hypothetical protein n=1 Tax=Tetraodon nigroviridis TaxID=99883 RepID=Q4T2Z7_TETNG|nr:unnamed protein product [Tetraodon nigroviridis]